MTDNEVKMFRLWLIEEKGLAAKSASDAISRCRRVERVFGLSLADTSEANRKLLLDRIGLEAASYLKPGANWYSAAVLRRAIRLYWEFSGKS